MSGTILVGITGASGSVYGLRLCEELLRAGKRVLVTASSAGIGVVREETNLDLSGGEGRRLTGCGSSLVSRRSSWPLWRRQPLRPPGQRLGGPGGYGRGPCSMGPWPGLRPGSRNAPGAVRRRDAQGGAPPGHRPRETPLSAIHLENMLKLARLGVRVVPAMPAFYHQPKTLDDLVDFVVGKVLDTLGVPHELFTRWGTP